MSAFGGARGMAARPPEKGIFPLDHFGECKQVAQQYLQCLRRHDAEASACKELSRRYLECRMERDLMAQQDLSELGLADPKQQQAESQQQQQQQQKQKE
ncbi:MAG: cytochrome c oxidase assembly protein COX19 [Monoraphidium minutum]|nr:MAG: cytochrome c oxidase assembly protein COX19 [Monoraphidium minutum]